MILAAAEQGLIPADEALARIAPDRYSDATWRLGSLAVGPPLARLLSEAVDRMVSVALPFMPPRVSQSEAPSDGDPARFSLDDDNQPAESLRDRLHRTNETDAEFDARQRQGWERFSAFETVLLEHGAELIVHDIGSAAVAAIAEREPATLAAIAERLASQPPARQARTVNLAARIARALSAVDPEAAALLFRCCEGHDGYLRITSALGSMPLLAWEAWHAVPSPTIEAYWAERLAAAASDHALACEVLAASRGGHQAWLESHAEEAISSGHPAAMARALIILGYPDRSSVAEAMLSRFAGTAGLVGVAARAARDAYTRNIWSRHWFEALAATADPVDF